MRKSVAILIAGAVVLLGGLVYLVRSMGEAAAPSPTVGATHPGPAAPAAPTAAPSHAPTTSARTPTKALSSLTHDVIAAREHPVAPTPAPALEPDKPPPGWGSNHLEYGNTQLRAQTRAVEPQVVQCIEQAAAEGVAPTGKAVVTFIAALKGDKVVIETTDYDFDKTTIGDAKLVECLRETARAMKLVGTPRDAPGVVVTRSISMDRGKLTENRFVSFSYLR